MQTLPSCIRALCFRLMTTMPRILWMALDFYINSSNNNSTVWVLLEELVAALAAHPCTAEELVSWVCLLSFQVLACRRHINTLNPRCMVQGRNQAWAVAIRLYLECKSSLRSRLALGDLWVRIPIATCITATTWTTE